MRKHIHAISADFYEHSHRNGIGWEKGNYPDHTHTCEAIARGKPLLFPCAGCGQKVPYGEHYNNGIHK